MMPSQTRLRTVRPRSSAQLAADYPVSVVIPARNCGPELRRCLSALLGNDLAEVEIIVVDDASSDETVSVATELSVDSMKVVRLTDQAGPAAARNRGVQQATKPLVLFLDADVILPAEAIGWIRESLDLYKHLPEVAGVLGRYSEQIPHRDFLTHYKNLYTCFLYRTTETLSPFIHTPIFCIRRDLLAEVGGFDSRFATAEDFRLGIVLGSAGYRFVIDRRIAGTHLKRYTLGSVLREDLRRIADLRRVTFTEAEREFSYQAHRWNRLLSVALPGPTLLVAASSFWMPGLLKSGLLMAGIFYLANWKFLQFCRGERGWVFAVGAAGFLFLEMLWAEVAVLMSSWKRFPGVIPPERKRS